MGLEFAGWTNVISNDCETKTCGSHVRKNEDTANKIQIHKTSLPIYTAAAAAAVATFLLLNKRK